jgi:hypothetical protein
LGSTIFDSIVLGFSALGCSVDFSRVTDFARVTENEEPPMPIKGRVSGPLSKLAMIRIFWSMFFSLESFFSRSSIFAEKS